MFKRLMASFVILCFSCSNIFALQAKAFEGSFNLPASGTMVNLSPAFEPALIKGMIIDQKNPFLFKFIIDAGQSSLAKDDFKNEGDRLIKYFFACLTIPEKDLWVNLSPYEKDRMIPKALGQTPLGRDLLAQDYILKQLTASMIYPEKDIGKEFWNRVYAKAQEQYGTTQIPVNTFNKVWIVADKGDVYENGQTAIVLGGHLKVMLEEDYLALQKHQRQPGDMTSVVSPRTLPTPQGLQLKAPQENNLTHSIASNIVRSIILPEIEKEVNTGKNFAMLRQIFNSLILATWYKKTLKEALFTQIYANKSIVKGVSLSDPSAKERIYRQYLRAYKKGVFNFIKEEPILSSSNVNKSLSSPNVFVGDPGHRTISRKYFSGGFDSKLTLAMLTSKSKGISSRLSRWLQRASLLSVFTVVAACNTLVPTSKAMTVPRWLKWTNNIALFLIVGWLAAEVGSNNIPDQVTIRSMNPQTLSALAMPRKDYTRVPAVQDNVSEAKIRHLIYSDNPDDIASVFNNPKRLNQYVQKALHVRADLIASGKYIVDGTFPNLQIHGVDAKTRADDKEILLNTSSILMYVIKFSSDKELLTYIFNSRLTSGGLNRQILENPAISLNLGLTLVGNNLDIESVEAFLMNPGISSADKQQLWDKYKTKIYEHNDRDLTFIARFAALEVSPRISQELITRYTLSAKEIEKLKASKVSQLAKIVSESPDSELIQKFLIGQMISASVSPTNIITETARATLQKLEKKISTNTNAPSINLNVPGKFETNPPTLKILNRQQAANVLNNGGIDLTKFNAGIKVSKNANGGVKVDVDPGMIARLKAEGLVSAVPVIINVASTNMAQIEPLLGMSISK